MLRVGIVVATMLVIVVIVYGTLQAQEEFSDEEVAISQPLAAEAAAAPYVPPELPAYYPPAPAREYELAGSDILYRVKGGDDPCRFLYTGNRVGTHAGTELKVWFVAGVWEADLDYGDELHLYGANGPHLFEIEGPDELTVLSLYVDHGATEYATVTFPVPGMYYLFDRERLELDIVGEITVMGDGWVGGGPNPDWCPS